MVRALTDLTDLGEQFRGELSLHQHWVALGHLTAELIHTLRGLVLGGKLAESVALIALRNFTDFGIDFVLPTGTIQTRAWELRNNLSAYDALYVALAEELRCPLLTGDARIKKSGATRCDIITIPATV